MRTYPGSGFRVALAGFVAMGLGLSACEGMKTEAVYPERTGTGGGASRYDPTGSNKQPDSVFGPGGLSILGGKKKDAEGGGGAGLGVNSFLWRGSLDTVAFMPLVSADPFGGVIITEWYSPPDAPNERFKINVYILDRALRADGVKVAVFRQVRQGAESWADAPVAPGTAANLENAILVRARQLRVDAAGL